MLLKLEKHFKTDLLTLAGVIVVAFLYLLLILVNFRGRLWSDLLVFWYPCYKSIKAIEKDDLKQWLGYWVIIKMVELGETMPMLLKVFPYYFVLKSIVAIGLMRGGAGKVYEAVFKRWIPVFDTIADKLSKFC